MSVQTNSQQNERSYPQISVLLLDQGGYDTLKMLRCLGQAPMVTSHIISRQRWPITRFSRYCKKCHYSPIQENSDLLESIRRLVLEHKIDVVLPVTIKDTEFLLYNQKALSDIVAIPPLPKIEMLKVAQDKWAFHCFAERYGLPIPSTILVADGQKTIADKATFDSIEYPALLKSTAEMGGYGIRKIESPSKFYHLVDNENILNKEHKYILQSYVPGVDFCLGVLCKNGKILTYTLQRNLIQSKNYFSYQKVMDFVNNNSIIKLGIQLVSAMVWDGIAFIDFRLDERDKSAKLLEINPRFGRALLGSLVAGVNFPFILCLTALGIDYTITQRENARYSHPSAYLNLLISRLLRRHNPLKLGWRESGWQLTLSDPLPDIVESLHHLRRKI